MSSRVRILPPARPSSRSWKRRLTTSSIVVEMSLDITADDSSKGSDELVDLTRVGASHGISDSDSVHSNLVDGSVEVKEVDQVGSEGVLRRESNLNTLGLDEVDD